MVSQTAFQLTLDFLTSKPVVVVPSADQVSSDAGLLPFRQLDEQLGLTRQFAEALTDRRHAGYVDHSFLEMTRMRVYGILADYADQNDHDVLRSDPIFKLLCDRSIEDDDLASQPTLSRFENAIDVRSFFRLRDLLLDQFIASFKKPPRQLTLDIDPFDDPTHGQQQLTFFHGYYEQYQYLPRVITCAENDLVLSVCLLHGTAHAALGAQDELEYVLRRLRAAWPDVQVHLRGDSGFGTPTMYAACEQLNIQYTIGIGMNARLKKLSDSLLEQAVSQWEATGQPQRLFTAFWYRADSWPAQRWVVIKCEANAQGTQPPRRGQQPRGSDDPAGGRLRRLCRPRREREPQQGTQGRFAGRPPQRSSLLRQPVPTLSAHDGIQPVGPHASRSGRSAAASRAAKKFPWRLSPVGSVAVGTTAVGSVIRWAKASPARGARG